jgi:hypothetical protein
MEQKGYSDMIFKVLDFLSGFWIIFWVIIVISAASYDPQLFFFMVFSLLLYTFPAIVYLSFRKRIRERFKAWMAKFQSQGAYRQQEEDDDYKLSSTQAKRAEEGEYEMGYREVKSEDSEIPFAFNIKLILTLIAVFLAIFVVWTILSR